MNSTVRNFYRYLLRFCPTRKKQLQLRCGNECYIYIFSNIDVKIEFANSAAACSGKLKFKNVFVVNLYVLL